MENLYRFCEYVRQVLRTLSRRIIGGTSIQDGGGNSLNSKEYFTSLNRPLEVFCVPAFGGTIGYCMAPGRKKEKLSHIWNRDLDVDLKILGHRTSRVTSNAA
eukprot:Filipodium_phascolosomae@DN1671_c0_g1_i1.p2